MVYSYTIRLFSSLGYIVLSASVYNTWWVCVCVFACMFFVYVCVVFCVYICMCVCVGVHVCFVLVIVRVYACICVF